jgi:hypothetical protein
MVRMFLRLCFGITAVVGRDGSVILRSGATSMPYG